MITYPPTLSWLHYSISKASVSPCSKQFSFLADCFIAHTLRPINKHLLSHDSDKWKTPLHRYEIVYPQKLLTWRYEKLGCPGIYHIPQLQCHFEIVKWLCHLLHLTWILPSQFYTSNPIDVLITSHSSQHPHIYALAFPTQTSTTTQPTWFRSLHHSRACGVVVHSSLTTGPQPTVVQERR